MRLDLFNFKKHSLKYYHINFRLKCINYSKNNKRMKRNRTEDTININKKKFPSLNIELPELKFPKFEGYEIQIADDFNTSCEEEEEDSNRETIDKSSRLIDRIRNEEGAIDLGLNKTDFGRLPNESDYHHKKSRKMINYDTYNNNNNNDNIVTTNKETKTDTVIQEIPFEFGDRGSNWRMMKLSKLEEKGKKPSKSKILEQYSTLWDYELACMERDEIRARKFKRKNEWIFKPSISFMKKKKYHDHANKIAMKDLIKKQGKPIEQEEQEDDKFNDRVIETKKYGDVKISKSKRIRNELKLSHLTSIDYNDPDEFTDTLSREKIESLTNF